MSGVEIDSSLAATAVSLKRNYITYSMIVVVEFCIVHLWDI